MKLFKEKKERITRRRRKKDTSERES